MVTVVKGLTRYSIARSRKVLLKVTSSETKIFDVAGARDSVSNRTESESVAIVKARSRVSSRNGIGIVGKASSGSSSSPRIGAK